MPELPEVETIRRDLESRIAGQKIEDILVYDCRVIREVSQRRFVQGLQGKTVGPISRRGKAIIIGLSGKTFLIVQPMMTGQLIFGQGPFEATKTTATKLTFLFRQEQYLHYNDYRLFGRLTLVDDLTKVKFLQKAGPEPLAPEFNLFWLKKELTKRKAPIKSLLMNQNFVAGIGNIYASEILFHARINPLRAANSLRSKEIALLHRMTTKVLKEAIEFRGTSMNTYRDASGEKGNFMNRIKVYGREEEQCFHCKSPIQKAVQAGRSTFFCERCQS